MRKSLLLLLTLACLNSVAQPPASTKTDLALQKLAQDAAIQSGEVGFIAVNMDNGKVIADRYGHKSMVPASIQKLITTAVALEKLGPGFQFKTVVSAAGNPDSGIVRGNIYVFPSGDPTLQSKYYESAPSSINRIKASLGKIKEFDGDIVIDASGFNQYNTPRGWIWEDIGNYFGSSPTALIWEDNMLEVYLNTGQTGTRAMLSNRTKQSDGFEIDVQVTASDENKDNAWFFGAPGSDVIYAKGTIPAHRTNFLVKAAHPNPMKEFGMDVLSAINQPKKEVKIDYDYIQHADLKPILTLHSPPLSNIIRICNQNSLNLYAESINMQLDTAARYKSVEGGISEMESFLKSKQIDLRGARFVDGSGLSPLNRMTCQTMIDVLTMMYRSKNKDAFMSSLPVAGQSGTIAGYFKNTPAEGNVKAKSGSMAGVRNYTGYLTNRHGETVAFCLMINDYDDAGKAVVMQKIEELLVALIED